MSVAFYWRMPFAFNKYSEWLLLFAFSITSIYSAILSHAFNVSMCVSCIYKWLNWSRILNANDGAIATVADVVNTVVTVTFPIQIAASDVNAWMQQIWLLFTIQLAVVCCYICISMCEKGNFNQDWKKKEIKVKKEHI